MVEAHIRVENRLGLHARAAAKLVRMVSLYDANVRLERADRSASADAKSILSLLMLAASRGTVLRLIADGADERQALEAVRHLFAEGFGEQTDAGTLGAEV